MSYSCLGHLISSMRLWKHSLYFGRSRLVILSEMQVRIYCVVLAFDELAYDFCQKLEKQKQKDLVHVHGWFLFFEFQLKSYCNANFPNSVLYIQNKCRPTFLVLNCSNFHGVSVYSQYVKHISCTWVSGWRSFPWQFLCKSVQTCSQCHSCAVVGWGNKPCDQGMIS